MSCVWDHIAIVFDLFLGTRLLLSVVSRSITRSIICIHLTSSYVLETYEERIVKILNASSMHRCSRYMMVSKIDRYCKSNR